MGPDTYVIKLLGDEGRDGVYVLGYSNTYASVTMANSANAREFDSEQAAKRYVELYLPGYFVCIERRPRQSA